MTPYQQAFDILSVARAYVAAGLSVIPITLGAKEPAGRLLPRRFDEATGDYKATWEPFKERQPTDAELVKWFSTDAAQLAIVTGLASGGVVVFDFDVGDAYHDWSALVGELVAQELLDRLPVVKSRQGYHVYFRMPDPIGNRKLAWRERTVLVETRGQGGYILAPPSRHPSGVAYEVIRGNLLEIPLLDAAQALLLLDTARALQPAVDHPASSGTGATGAGDVIGAFNQAHTIEAILEAAGYMAERPGRYIRPDGERSSVVIHQGRSTHYNSRDILHSEAPDGRVYSHTPFSAWCVLHYSGDVKAAVKAAAAELGLRQTTTDRALLTQAGRALGLVAGDDEIDSTWPYFVDAGALWMHRHAADGTPQTPQVLCNFTARITRETQLDDGEHQEEFYTLTATCGAKTRQIELKRSEFESEGAVGKIVAALGARARVNPRTQPRYLLDAIKAFSRDVAERTIHTHTGWVSGRYLFGNGYVDASGWHAGAGCQLPQRLQQYRLLPPATPMPDVMAVFEDLLTLAPSSVMIPLLGGVLLAPIAHNLQTAAPMIHLYGPTGCHKTSISCAALALFGAFTPAQPTDSWTSTANSIQRIGWHLKDAPMLLDDYKRANVKEQQVTFLLQNYGDGMARGRLDANSEARAAYPLRSVLISSGEDQPEGEASALARILCVAVERKAVHRGKLTRVQKDAALLHEITVAYLAWLARQTERLSGTQALHEGTRAAILCRLEEATEHATNPGRIASNVAALFVAWDMFGCFLVEHELWSSERVQAWLVDCKHALYNLARGQIELTTQERYSQIFLETLRGLLASGKCIMLDLNGGYQEMLTTQTLIGGYDQTGTFLIAQVAYDEVCKHLRAAGRNATFSLRALSQLFDQDGLLCSTQPPSKVVRKRINRIVTWCWHLPAGVLEN